MKLNKLLILVAAVFTLASCSNDDPGVNEVTLATLTVDATLSTANGFTAEQDNLPFTVNLSQSFGVDATVVVQFKFADGRFINSTLALPSGSSSVSGTQFLVPDDGVLLNAFSLTGTVIGKVIGVNVNGGVSGSQVIVNSNELALNEYDAFPLTNDDNLEMMFTWDGRFNGTDIDVYTDDFATIVAATGNPQEFASVPDATTADATYNLVYNPFALGGTADERFVLSFNHNGTFTNMVGSLPAANNDDTAIYPLATLVKATDTDGVVTWTITQLQN